MKNTYFLLAILLLLTLFNVNTSRAQGQGAQVLEQLLTHADTLTSEESTEPIIKTVVIEEEEKELSTRDKWITGILAAFGFVGVLVFRLLRRKKKVERKPE